MVSTHINTYPFVGETLPDKGFPEIVVTLDRLNDRLHELRDDFVVIGGANLVLRGIRRATTDIDMLVSDDVFTRMQDFEGIKIKNPPKRALDQGATNVSIWIAADWVELPISAAKEMGDGYYPMSYANYEDEDPELFAGHACAPLDHVWGSKVALQRPKDLSDLYAIAKITGQSTFFPPPVYTGPYQDS